MGEGDSFKDEAARLGPAYQQALTDLRRSGWIRRRRLRGDYLPTPKGMALYRDYNRHHEEALARVEAMAAKLQTGEMTPIQGQVRLIQLMGDVLQALTSQEKEAVANLRAIGFDPVEALREAGYHYTPPESEAAPEAEAVPEPPDPAAWLEALGLEGGLLRDEQWRPLDGEICRATAFRSFPDAQEDWRFPYAAIEVESPVLAEPRIGYITHQVDFQHLSEAFAVRGAADDKEVIVVYSKSKLPPASTPDLAMMPGLLVWVCPKHAYQLMTDPSFMPELKGDERLRAQSPIESWTPEPLR